MMLPSPILMVCSGNICRSPFAEFYLRSRLQQAGEFAEVFSRGILDMHSRSVPDTGIAVAADMGVDLAPHRATKLEGSDLDRAALVMIMEQQHRQYLAQMRPAAIGKIFYLSQPTGGAEIPDPMGKSDEDFRDSYRVIVENIDGWLKRFGVTT
ncbi:MAG: low molecular weight protein-tyrosine-phosphatase [Mariprofundales bacterium]|nr:low molecular weight protein-tyrosine-phosphatase [Mariprofundales bacterium]